MHCILGSPEMSYKLPLGKENIGLPQPPNEGAHWVARHPPKHLVLSEPRTSGHLAELLARWPVVWLPPLMAKHWSVSLKTCRLTEYKEFLTF